MRAQYDGQRPCGNKNNHDTLLITRYVCGFDTSIPRIKMYVRIYTCVYRCDGTSGVCAGDGGWRRAFQKGPRVFSKYNEVIFGRRSERSISRAIVAAAVVVLHRGDDSFDVYRSHLTVLYALWFSQLGLTRDLGGGRSGGFRAERNTTATLVAETQSLFRRGNEKKRSKNGRKDRRAPTFFRNTEE